MKHNHRITPGHMGGEYVEGNVIKVEVTACDKETANHVMWHYANWKLWGKVEDKIAWRGLAGFLNKEEIIQNLQNEGREKAKETLKTKFKNKEHPFLSRDLINKRKEINSKYLKDYNKSERGREKSKLTVTKTNLKRIKCPHCDFISNPGNLAKHLKCNHLS